ncbi:hypothetical protein C4J65_01760 [Streptomyces sp. CB09001]|uniref:hypothetical protein n=1 Tax=Streptomyces sp. CB09001 TaxID=2083284 RepID=UPI000E214262|nr:hypothetical protein [Streptomyces sp. CB09001]AXL87172.1 hypothetical protein C4J65_01760 [Streptomyces sp. CB09001]
MMNNLTPLEPKADKATVRRHNLSLVLRAVHDAGEATRAGVATHVGLTRAAVSSPNSNAVPGGATPAHCPRSIGPDGNWASWSRAR